MKEKIPKNVRSQIIFISVAALGASIFFYFEGGIFNTYINNILGLEYFFIALMVSLSAIMGLIFTFVFGVISDNTRSELGRRRPYLLFGVIAGITMILYSFSPSYIWCLIFDVIIIGVAANAYNAATKVIIPDVVAIQYRGRANAITNLTKTIGGLIPLGLTLLAYEFFTVESESGLIISQQGFFFLLLFGGGSFILCAVISFLKIKEPLSPSQLPPRKTFKQELKETFNIEALKENKEVFKMILTLTIFNIGPKVISIYLYLYILSLGLDTLLLILAVAVLGPLTFLSTYLAGKFSDIYGRKKVAIPLLIISAIGCVFMPFAGSGNNAIIPLLFFGTFFLLQGMTTVKVPIDAWKQDLLPENKRAQFAGIMNIANTLNQIPAAFLAAAVADTFGVQWIFLVVAIFFAISIPFFYKINETLIEDNLS
ncbi:MAG: MFS transporter [Promethearchaeia archaeon]